MIGTWGWEPVAGRAQSPIFVRTPQILLLVCHCFTRPGETMTQENEKYKTGLIGKEP
jgi:hypothetical protein